MDKEAERRIEDLEFRLNQYHQALEEAVEQRDRLALDAAWGVVSGLNYLISFAIAIAVIGWLEQPWWLETIVFVVLQFGLHFLMVFRTEGLREADIKKLWSLPRW